MNGEKENNVRLDQVFEKYAALQLQQSSETNKRIDLLVGVTGSMAEKLGSLAEIIAKSEERHSAHSEKSDRIEKVQIAQGKEFKEYRQKNDDRIMTVEKQVLLLDVGDGITKDRWKAIDKFRASILAAIVLSAILIFLGLK